MLGLGMAGAMAPAAAGFSANATVAVDETRPPQPQVPQAAAWKSTRAGTPCRAISTWLTSATNYACRMTLVGWQCVNLSLMDGPPLIPAMRLTSFMRRIHLNAVIESTQIRGSKHIAKQTLPSKKTRWTRCVWHL